MQGLLDELIFEAFPWTILMLEFFVDDGRQLHYSFSKFIMKRLALASVDPLNEFVALYGLQVENLSSRLRLRNEWQFRQRVVWSVLYVEKGIG